MSPPDSNPVPESTRRPRRRTFLLSLALLLLAAGVLSLPAVHWWLIGWWRGEAFYQGRPTSWWEQEIEQYYVAPQPSGPWYGPMAAPTAEHLAAVVDRPATTIFKSPPLLSGEVEALPVLRELLQGGRRKSRLAAVSGLRDIGDQTADALAPLRQAAQADEDDQVRLEANAVVQWLEYKAEMKAAAK